MTSSEIEELAIHVPEAPPAPVARLRARSAPRRRFAPLRWEAASAATLHRDKVVRWMLAAADCITALLALTLVAQVIGNDQVTAAGFGAIPLLLLIHKTAGLYDADPVVIRRSTLDEVPQLAQLAGLYTLGVAIFESAMIEGSLGHDQLALLWVTVSAMLAGGRYVARLVSRRITPPERCLVIGDPTDVERIRGKLAAGNAHVSVVAALPLRGDTVDVPGGSATIRRLASHFRVQRIIIAPATPDGAGLVGLIRTAKASGVRVSVLPRMLEAIGSRMELETLDGMTVLGVRPFGLTRSSLLLKRAFDLTGALIGLLATAPLLLVIAVAIRLDSRGPILFRQTRIGRDGECFRILKFRTMVTDAEALKAGLTAYNEAADGFFKIADDPRITRVGSFLRRTSLDELPQILNVIRGEMSLVGPRPLVRDEDVLVTGLDRQRLHLTPGMTGPWQVLGSSRIPMQEMVGIDYLYVAGWSLWGDLKILVRTVQHVFGGGNR